MTQTTTLQVSDWLPDEPPQPPVGSTNIVNVQPRTATSYGPIGSPMPVSSALDYPCQGACAYLDPANNVNLFAGTRDKLYRLTAGDAYVWQDVTSQLVTPIDWSADDFSHDFGSGRTPSGYNVSADAYWEFEYFNGTVLATQIADNIQAFKPSSDTYFSDLAQAAPRAKHMAVVKNSFVMVGSTYDGTDGTQPQRVWWSGAGDATSWPTPGGQVAAQLQSSFVDLLGSDGEVQAIRAGLAYADALVFQEHAVRACFYAGPPQVFQFLPLQNARGTPAPYSPVVVGGVAYYYAWDGWYANDGTTATPIGVNKVNKFFQNDADLSSLHRMTGAADPLSQMLWWTYVSKASPNGLPDKLIGYNWALQRWSPALVAAEYLVRFISLGYTLDQLYTILGYTLDTLPAPLDSPLWAGGALQLALFNSDHKLSYFTGAALPATVETVEVQAVPGRRAVVTGARPLIDGSGTGGPTVAMGHRERQIDMVQYSTATGINAIGNCPQRTSGRYLRAQIKVGAGGDWSNISGIDLQLVPAGQR